MENAVLNRASGSIEDLVTTNEIEKRWGVKPDTVRKWKQQRKIWPKKRIRGRTMLFLASDVETLIADDPFYDAWVRERSRG